MIKDQMFTTNPAPDASVPSVPNGVVGIATVFYSGLGNKIVKAEPNLFHQHLNAIRDLYETKEAEQSAEIERLRLLVLELQGKLDKIKATI
jgi:hypothetical protein